MIRDRLMALQKENHYQVLDVDNKATFEEINEAYKKLVVELEEASKKASSDENPDKYYLHYKKIAVKKAYR